ncbi:MAG: M48 family metalloprotease [Deltaproteobacteria bacterium]|nr:M48 family metalloprotease [Deltaproteobacteria bacterium]NIS76857.1 M48 family metalloprotease [Deltaproteobacteria bacterium]
MSGYNRIISAGFWLFLAVSACIVPLVFSGCAVNPVTGKTEFHLVSVTEEEEIELGRKSYVPIVQQEGGFYRDQRLEGYVQSVGDRLAKVSHRPGLPYTFRVLNSSVPNAFALPGGFIVINRGLLVGLSSEGELAGVLGHEIGHATARHSVAAYQRALGLNIALLGVAVAGGSNMTMQLSSIGAGLIQNGFSREQERESDYLGVDYMVKAGYDPRGAIDLQEYFYKQFERGKNTIWIEGLFRTHPFSEERLENVKRYSREKHPQSLDGKGYVVNEGVFIDRTERLREVQRAYDVYDEGVKLLNKKDRRGALEKFRRAMEMEPDQAPFHTKAGLVFLLDDDAGAAIEYLEKAVQIDPELAESRVYLGISYHEVGKCGQAVVHLEKSMESMPTKTAAKYLGKCYRKMGDSEKAAKYEGLAR